MFVNKRLHAATKWTYIGECNDCIGNFKTYCIASCCRRLVSLFAIAACSTNCTEIEACECAPCRCRWFEKEKFSFASFHSSLKKKRASLKYFGTRRDQSKDFEKRSSSFKFGSHLPFILMTITANYSSLLYYVQIQHKNDWTSTLKQIFH